MRHRVAWWYIPEDNFLPSQRLTASKLTMKKAGYRGKLNRDVVTAYTVKECKGSRVLTPLIPKLGNRSRCCKETFKISNFRKRRRHINKSAMNWKKKDKGKGLLPTTCQRSNTYLLTYSMVQSPS